MCSIHVCCFNDLGWEPDQFITEADYMEMRKAWESYCVTKGPPCIFKQPSCVQLNYQAIFGHLLDQIIKTRFLKSHNETRLKKKEAKTYQTGKVILPLYVKGKAAVSEVQFQTVLCSQERSFFMKRRLFFLNRTVFGSK